MPESDPQQLAAASEAANLLVVAPPGCGKTELLALRACALIPRLLPNQRILALTFTNRAKANLSERLRRALGVERFRRYITVHNFHGHAAEVILAHGKTIGIQLDGIGMPTTKTLRNAITRFSSDPSSRRGAEELLALTKRAPLSDAEVVAALDAAGDALAKRVELERIASNQLHYEDLLRHAQRLLAVDEVARLYQQHYGAILVDEFQDLSMQQLDLVLRTSKASRTFAGDPMQGIFSWAGADPVRVQEKLKALCDGPIQLSVSYRSSPAVLGMVNTISSTIGVSPLRASEPSAWLDGGVAAAFSLKTVSGEAQLIARLSARILQGDPRKSIGVITRSGWRRAELDKTFSGLPDIPCRRWDLALDDPTILGRLQNAVNAMPKGVTFEEARLKVIHNVDPSDVDTLEQVQDAFELLAAVSASSVRAALAQFSVREADAAIGPGVHLLNAHTGKGQQFDWVFIPGFEEKHLPDRRSTEGNALAEEKRVLLVMLSRAKHGVVITKSKMLDGKYGPYASVPSRWWSQLAAAATMDYESLNIHLEKLYPEGPGD